MVNETLSLKENWEKASAGLRDHEAVRAMVEALLAGRFAFAREAWHGPDGEIACELLLRVWDAQGLKIGRGVPFAAVAADGTFGELGAFLTFAALAKADPANDETLSINVLPSTLASPTFWEDLERGLNGHQPENIIFEILEHETAWRVDDDLMRMALQNGYRFALDDFNPLQNGWARLAAFAPYLSFVKIDGPIVRAGLAGDPVLKETVERLRRDYPDLRIVAEFVQNGAEAKLLYDLGVTAVQGEKMPRAAHDTIRPRPAP